MISVTVFVTPAGTRDAGGVLQPAYLNFDAQLLGPPAPGMKVCAAPCITPLMLRTCPPFPQPRQQISYLHYQLHACCAGLLLHLHQHMPLPVPCHTVSLLPLC